MMGKKHQTTPTFREEQLLWDRGIRFVAGIDEVGRGALAGPVVAAAVVFDPSVHYPREFLEAIHDSKLLTHQKRLQASSDIKQYATSYAVAEIAVSYVDKLGIVHASHMAFRKAIKNLSVTPDFLLIDAFYISGLKKNLQKPIIKGDQKSLSIAAASILAKVYRDERMGSLHKRFALYNFNRNKGYGTKAHREMIKLHGLCRLHRTSFNLTKFL